MEVLRRRSKSQPPYRAARQLELDRNQDRQLRDESSPLPQSNSRALSLDAFNNSSADAGLESSPLFRKGNNRTSSLILDMAFAEKMALLESCGRLDFDTLKFTTLPGSEHPLQIFGAHSMQKTDLIGQLHRKGWVQQQQQFQVRVLRFLGEIDGLYRTDVIYHGSAHGTDVMATMEWLLRLPYFRDRTTMLDHFMGVMAAAIHDVGHPGMNNLFQSKTMAPLALRYNDKSILENMHVSLAFELMRSDDQCNWFALLPNAFQRKKEGDDTPSATTNFQQYMRRGMIGMVLATDMANHAQHVTKFQNVMKEADEEEIDSPEEMKQEALDHKLFILESMLHAADISNPCKPRPQMLQWTELVLLEFWNQGDEERRLGLPVSPLCDREAGRDVIPKGQLGFINFVIRPLYSLIVELVPQADEALENLAQNSAFWEEKDREHATYEQIFGDVARSPRRVSE